MAYSVAKELSLRPMVILTEWTCEELLVAYGVYINQQTKESFDMMSKKDRAIKHLSWLDRWAMPFFSRDDLKSMAQTVEEESEQAKELDKISQALFG